MSAQANIVAFDGATTPVSHTIFPIGVESISGSGEQIAMWREQNTVLPVYAQIRVKTSQKKQKNGTYRVATVVEVPVMESVSGQNSSGYTAAPKVAYTNTFQLVGYYHERSTIADRRLIRQLALNIGGNIQTSVTVVGSGPSPELHDLLVTAS